MSRIRQSAGNSWPLLTFIICPGLHSAHVTGTYLLNFLVIQRFSTILLLILSVTTRYRYSNTTFRMHIKIMLTFSATIGNVMSIMSNSLSLMSTNKTNERTFSKWKVESIKKYHMPRRPWYLFAKIMFEFTIWSVISWWSLPPLNSIYFLKY